MTRRVNFSSQQRVDLPDQMAIGAFAAMDARRILRQTLMGADAAADKGRVLRGFRVEAEDPGVSPRIIIRMDQGGGVYSGVMAAINSGLANVDWGQIAGGIDGLNNLEGSAQNILDLTGQPAAVYPIKLRVQFAPGIKDNRAFWNPAANAEFIAPTPTRLLPQWEVAFQGHSDPEWVTLADIDWDGVSVNTDDITDLRAFPLEGEPKSTQLVVDQWSFPEQTGDADTFGVGDFDRGADRAEVQVPGIWAGMRALGRQIQDIKGGRDSDLRYDWFSRPSSAPGLYAADNNIVTTRTMRMMDTVTYTCSDGVTDQGDFSGLDSIFNCFKFIQDNPAKTPRRITILVKSRSISTPIFTWSENITIVDKDITLIAVGGSASVGVSGVPSGNITIVVDTLVGGNALNMSSISTLHLENITIADGTGIPEDVGLINMSQQSEFSCFNSLLVSPNLTGAGAATLRCVNTNLKIEKSLLVGLCYMGGKSDPGGSPIPQERDADWSQGQLLDSNFVGHMRFRFDTPAGATESDAFWYANKIKADGCTFTSVVETGQANALAAGMVDLTGCRNLLFTQCTFAYAGDETGVVIKGGPVVFGAAWSKPESISFLDCIFKLSKDAEHEGRLTGAGGVSGDIGTGWAINIYGGEPGPDPYITSFQSPRHINIDGCTFDAGLNPLTAGDIVSPADAGYVRVFNSQNVSMENNRIVHWTHPTPGQTSDAQILVWFNTDGTGVSNGAGTDHAFVDNFVGDWQSFGGTKWGDAAIMVALATSVCDRVKVRGNTLSAIRRETTIAPNFGTFPAAMIVEGCLNADIEHNHFVGWREPGAPLNNICVGLESANVGCNFVNNRFVQCGGANIILNQFSTLMDCHFTGNRFLVGLDETLWDSCIDLTTDGGGDNFNTYVDNSWDYDGGGGAKDGIRFESTFGVVMSNYFRGGFIRNAAGLGPFSGLAGFNVAGANAGGTDVPDPNVVAGYAT